MSLRASFLLTAKMRGNHLSISGISGYSCGVKRACLAAFTRQGSNADTETNINRNPGFRIKSGMTDGWMTELLSIDKYNKM